MNAEQRKELMGHLSAYLDGELDDEQRGEIEALLEQDPSAQRLLDELRMTAALVADLPRAEASDDLLESLSGRMERQALLDDAVQAQQPPPERSWSGLRWLAVAAVAAISLTSVYLLWPGFEHQPGHQYVMDDSAADESAGGREEESVGETIYRMVDEPVETLKSRSLSDNDADVAVSDKIESSRALTDEKKDLSGGDSAYSLFLEPAENMETAVLTFNFADQAQLAAAAETLQAKYNARPIDAVARQQARSDQYFSKSISPNPVEYMDADLGEALSGDAFAWTDEMPTPQTLVMTVDDPVELSNAMASIDEVAGRARSVRVVDADINLRGRFYGLGERAKQVHSAGVAPAAAPKAPPKKEPKRDPASPLGAVTESVSEEIEVFLRQLARSDHVREELDKDGGMLGGMGGYLTDEENQEADDDIDAAPARTQPALGLSNTEPARTQPAPAAEMAEGLAWQRADESDEEDTGGQQEIWRRVLRPNQPVSIDRRRAYFARDARESRASAAMTLPAAQVGEHLDTNLWSMQSDYPLNLYIYINEAATRPPIGTQPVD